jgi:hypothetical protein
MRPIYKNYCTHTVRVAVAGWAGHYVLCKNVLHIFESNDVIIEHFALGQR